MFAWFEFACKNRSVLCRWEEHSTVPASIDAALCSDGKLERSQINSLLFSNDTDQMNSSELQKHDQQNGLLMR